MPGSRYLRTPSPRTKDGIASINKVTAYGAWPTHRLFRDYKWFTQTTAARGSAATHDGDLVARLGAAQKQQWIMSIMYPILLMLFKLSILAFYRRFLPRQPYRRWIYATAACSVMFSIAAAIATVLQFVPLKQAWEKPFSSEHYRRTQVLPLFMAIGAFNLAADVIIVLLPLPEVVRLRTNRKQKELTSSFYRMTTSERATVGLILLFLLGAHATAITAVRLWSVVHLAALSRRRAGLARMLGQIVVLTLLSGCELAIVPLCANVPALAACWLARGRHRRRRRRGTNTPTAQQRRRQQQQQQQQRRLYAQQQWQMPLPQQQQQKRQRQQRQTQQQQPQPQPHTAASSVWRLEGGSGNGSDAGRRAAAFAGSKSDVDVDGAASAGRSCWISEDGSGCSAESVAVAVPAAAAACVLDLAAAAAAEAAPGMCEAGTCSCGLETESSDDEPFAALAEKGADDIAFPKRVLEI